MFYDEDQIEPVIFHRGTASGNIFRRTYQWSESGVTPSTVHPNSLSSSATTPPGYQGEHCDPASMRISTSLSGLPPPRAAEPKRRTLIAPCLAASSRISCRFSCKSFLPGTFPPYHEWACLSPLPLPCRHATFPADTNHYWGLPYGSGQGAMPRAVMAFYL